jgi:hypothetical protein
MSTVFQDNGKLSWSRIAGTVLLANYLLQANISFFTGNDFPDISTNLAYLIAGLYGLNVMKVAGNIIANKPQRDYSPFTEHEKP